MPYDKAFPDYDDVLDPFPGMKDVSWRNDAMPSFENAVAGLRLWCDYGDPSLCSETEIETARRAGDMGRFALVRIAEDGGEGEEIASDDDIDVVAKAYAEAWMNWVATTGIGLGFHPDTPSNSYDPPLDDALREQYDDMISFCHEHLDDVYATGLDAWTRAGMIETPSHGGRR